MQRLWIDGLTVFWVSAEESASSTIIVSGAEVVEAEVRVVLFAAIEIVVGRRPDFGEAVAVGVVLLLVRHYASRVSDLADAAAAVVDVEARRPCVVAGESWTEIFADAL